MYFSYFVIISPWKRAEPFIWTNLNHLHSLMLCAKFSWNWPSGSGEEDWKCEKFTTTTMTTDKFWSEKLLEPLAQVSELKKEMDQIYHQSPEIIPFKNCRNKKLTNVVVKWYTNVLKKGRKTNLSEDENLSLQRVSIYFLNHFINLKLWKVQRPTNFQEVCHVTDYLDFR